jgi:hypothetical protein
MYAAVLVVLVIVAAVVLARGGSVPSGFQPVPVSTCRGGPCDGPCSGGCGGANGCRRWYDEQYAVEMGRGNGAALWDPYYGQARVRDRCCPGTGREHAIGADGLSEGFAAGGCAAAGQKETVPFGCGAAACGPPRPGDTALDQYNPVTGVGAHTDVRRSAERYCRGAPLQRYSVYSHQPGQPGYMAPLTPDAGLSADLALRDARSPGLPPGCSLTTVDPDADFLTDGLFGAAILNGTSVTLGGC